MEYTTQINEMKQLIGNIALHLNYNHPGEAAKMLNTLILKAQNLKDEIEKWLSKQPVPSLSKTF